MAKNKKEEKNNRQEKAVVKKKKHGCRNCLLALLVFIVVISTGLYFVGNFFTKKLLDMKLWDCFAVIHDLTSAKPKKIVQNSYTASDYTQFNSELKGQLFLNENADFSIDRLLASLTGSGEDADEGESEEETETVEGYFVRSAETLGASIDSSAISHLTEVFVRDNIDMEALHDYDAAKHSETNVFNVTDRMLAAALDKATDQIARGIPFVANYLDQFGIAKASEVLKFEQVVFDSRNGTKDGQAASVKVLAVTVSVDARKLATAYLKVLTKYDLGFLCKAFLPKRIYATAVVPVEENAAVENNVYINNMNDKKMNRAYKLVDNVTELTGSRMELKEKISSAVNSGSVGDIINKVNSIFPIDEAVNHTVSLDIFESLINVSGFNKVDGELKEEEKQIHASDLIYTLGGLVASDMEDAVKEEYDYNHQWFDSKENKVVYDKTLNPGTQIAGKTWQDYRQLFMDEVAAKYLLDLVIKKEGEPDYVVTFDDLMRLFGLGGSNSEGKNIELLDLFAPKRLHETTGMSPEERKVKIDSRMLGAILQSQINSLIDGGGSLGNFDPELVYVYTYDEYLDGVKHNMMETAIAVDAALLVSKGGAVGSVMTGLIGEKVIITFNVDITPDAEEYIAGELRYNGISNEKTDSILKTISAFVSDFDKQSLLGQVEEPIRNTMRNMNDVIRIELCSSKIDLDATWENQFTPPAVELPTIFETIKQMMFKDDEENEAVREKNLTITPDKIETVMFRIDDVNDENFDGEYIGDDGVTMLYDEEGNLVLDDNGKPISTYANSLDIIIDKYFIGEKEDGSKYTTFDELFGTDGVGGAIDSSDFNADNFRFDDLYHDTRPIDAADDTEDLHPKFDDNDLAALLIEKMHKDGSGIYDDIKDIRGLRITVSDDGEHITLYVMIDTRKLVDENSKDNARLLPADYAYLKATVDLGSIAYYNKSGDGKTEYDTEEEIPEGEEASYKKFYRTELTVNNMNEDEYGWLQDMMFSLGKGENPSLDLEVKARDIGSIVLDQIETLRKSIGSDITFVDGGIELVTVYDFLKKSFNSSAAAETVRAAIQGLAEEKEGGTSDYNYRSGDIRVNELYDGEIAVELGTVTKLDNEFGKMLSGGFTVAGNHVPGTLAQGENGAFELVQLNILHGTLGARSGFIGSFVTDATDESVAGMLDTIDDGTFVEFTFKTTVSKLLDADAENKLSSVAPEFIYFTILTRKGDDGFEEIYFRINEMNYDSQEVLLGDFLKLDETQITDQIAKCISALGHYSDAEYDTVDYVSGGAFGKVTFTQIPGIA